MSYSFESVIELIKDNYKVNDDSALFINYVLFFCELNLLHNEHIIRPKLDFLGIIKTCHIPLEMGRGEW